jgi:hypothetical protein
MKTLAGFKGFFVVFVFVIAFALALAACGSGPDSTVSSTSSASSTSSTDVQSAGGDIYDYTKSTRVYVFPPTTTVPVTVAPTSADRLKCKSVLETVNSDPDALGTVASERMKQIQTFCTKSDFFEFGNALNLADKKRVGYFSISPPEEQYAFLCYNGTNKTDILCTSN